MEFGLIYENMVNEKNNHGNDAEHYKFIGGYLVTNMVQCPMKHYIRHQNMPALNCRNSSKIHGMEHILENDHGSQANNWEIESRTTDRIWTLSWNMDRDYGFIYVKRDN
ncbi:hypothetical protein DERF_007452 [Dermatophagoides farinae]|uniref:Uncharacterized protein n=1 Tax=Dermatophagoides farinae TaxID=6954 RepID=A0A922L3N1_DERFA|nr:hypothetical protein DERF_007452 [Dermatophagoides farinae]